MCWFVKYQPKMETAKEDIKVFKVINWDGVSLYQDFPYEVGKTYNLGKELEVEYDVRLGDWRISEGFHSFHKDSYFAFKFCEHRGKVYRVSFGSMFGGFGNYFEHYLVALCTIPKGANYYFDDERGHYVSDSIRCDEMIKLGEYLKKESR